MKFLIIQTAFIGDVILATPIIEKLNFLYPESQIDFLLRKGNEGLFDYHPYIEKLYVWDKGKGKYKNLLKIIGKIRKHKYDYVINLQRFAATGFVTFLSKANNKIGFDKNPFSKTFTKVIPHQINNGKHETIRNLELIKHFTNDSIFLPQLHPSWVEFDKMQSFKNDPYICIAPASVWFTKQFPKEKWIELIKLLNDKYKIYLIGGKTDANLCDEIIKKSQVKRIDNMAGRLTFLETSALIKNSEMNYVNDSAPMHIASAVNAATTAVFCSTIPEFGFGPLGDSSRIVQAKEKLNCRPCGLHGKSACPEGHFNCAYSIDIKDLLF